MKRFDFASYPHESYMEEIADGEYCLYDDYEALEKRAIAAESKLAEIGAQPSIGYIYSQGLRDLNNIGAATIYKEKQKFILTAPQKETAIYALQVQPLPALAVPQRLIEALKKVMCSDRSCDKKCEHSACCMPEVRELYQMLSTPTPPSAEQPKCKMCNGHGLIGGFNGQDYDSDICPECNLVEQPDSEAVEPILGYKHIMFMECDQKQVRFSESGINAFGVGGKDYSKEYRVVSIPLSLHRPSSNHNPQRITEQELREIAQLLIDMGEVRPYFDIEIFTGCDALQSLLAKLNENREPDYKAQIEALKGSIAVRDEQLAGKDLQIFRMGGYYVESLRTYGKHLINCLGDVSGRECTCGLSIAIAKASASNAEGGAMIANRDEARAKIAGAGITAANVTDVQLQLLRNCIDSAMIASGRYEGSYRMKKQASKFMKCCTNQWDGREAVSFNTDGFISFAGWADDRNIRPILDGVEQWLDKLSIAS